MDAATSFKMAQRFLLGTQTALDSCGYDAAYANASVAATFAVRVLAADQSDRTPDRESAALVDIAEANGQLPGRAAREVKALLDLRWRGVFEPVDRDAATSARGLASCVTATAARRLSLFVTPSACRPTGAA